MEIKNQIVEQENTHKSLRKLLLVLYGFGLIFSLVTAFGVFFIFDGGNSGVRQGIFFSAQLIPVSIIFAMFLSKKSLWWFVLPFIPWIIFSFLDNSLLRDMRNSDKEFCVNMSKIPGELEKLKAQNVDCNIFLK